MREEQRATARAPLVGETLGDAYRVVRLMGEGAMGGIYEARQLRLDKRVAIKVLARELAANGEALLRFHREAEITSQLGHPHIINVFDFGTTDNGQPYLVMEYLEGEDLANQLHRKGSLSLPPTVRITKQVASALAETHAKGVVHRDLKPANMFIVRVQGEDFAKVLDFGISKVRAASTALTNASTLMGTPMYMAPEQAKGDIELDHLTDQWALACITFEMLAGRPPFVGDDTAALLYQVVHEEPPRLSNFVKDPAGRRSSGSSSVRSRKHPAERFPNVTAFARAFEAAATGQALPAEPAARRGRGSAPASRSRRSRRRRRWRAAPRPSRPPARKRRGRAGSRSGRSSRSRRLPPLCWCAGPCGARRPRRLLRRAAGGHQPARRPPRASRPCEPLPPEPPAADAAGDDADEPAAEADDTDSAPTRRPRKTPPGGGRRAARQARTAAAPAREPRRPSSVS